MGKIGAIAQVHTGGVAGCTSASVGSLTPGWCTGGTFSNSSSIDGGLTNPKQISTDGTTLFVADYSHHRINKYNASTGAFIGWMGGVSQVQAWTGNIAGATPGTAYTDTGFDSPRGIFNDGTYLYTFEDLRLKKHTLSSGAPQGWSGQVLTTPTGGDAGCTALAVLGFTPGWCTGGSPQQDATDNYASVTLGSMSSGYVWGDGSYLYRVDGRNVITKTTVNGVFVGWIGKIYLTPTGGVAGCTAAAVGTFTPGWCVGGAGQAGSGDGMMSGGGFLWGDSTYLYAGDYNNHRVNRYLQSDGSFAGWIGSVLTTPTGTGTGGAAGCTSASPGSPTPGWCTGGTAQIGQGDGKFGGLAGIWTDGTYLYVADSSYDRVNKFNAVTGAFIGWIGNTSTTGLSGGPGCAAVVANGTLPGWCTGGTSRGTSSTGSFNAPTGIVGDGTYLYVVDRSNYRIEKINLATGSAVGWKGRILTVPSSGDSGCSSASIGQVTPGWCSGVRLRGYLCR